MPPRRLQAAALAGLLMVGAIHLQTSPPANTDHNLADLDRAIARAVSISSGYATEAAPSRRHKKAYTVRVSQATQDVDFDIDTETETGRIITAIVRSQHLALVGGLYSTLTPRDLPLARAVAAAERSTGGTAIAAKLRALGPVSYEVALTNAKGLLVVIVEGGGEIVRVVRKRA